MASSDDAKAAELVALDASALEEEQANMLAQQAGSSAISVLALVVLFSLAIAFIVSPVVAASWFAVATFMIAVTLVQPRLFGEKGAAPLGARRYLQLHTAVSAVTGCVWGVGAAWQANPSIDVSVYTGVAMVVTITLGGISPHSAYRPAYVALASFTMLPYAIWVLFSVSWPLHACGIGIVIAYAYFMSASARVEIGTQNFIAARRNIELTEELRNQRDKIAKISEDKTRFLSATSHDLAQPLHAQGFYLDVLRKRADDPALLDIVDKIEATSRSLGQLLDGLVEISRIDAGALVPNVRVVDGQAVVQRTIDEMAGVAADKGVELTAEFQSVSLVTDPVLLARIVRNLLSNAIKFTPAGGRVAVTTTPDLTSDGATAVISVVDTGIGIPSAALDTVFDEYVQLTNPERNREKGLGLGLAIVRRLVDLMDMELAIHSTPSVGTTIELLLPATDNLAEQEKLDPPARDNSSASLGSMKILVVDDEEAIRLAMSEVLTIWGHEVFCIASGEDVVSFLDAMDLTPDVMIVDYRLGSGVQGDGLIAAVRAEVNELVPAILMSGDAAPLQQLDVPEAVLILRKPIDPQHLKAALAQCVSVDQGERTASAVALSQ